MTMTTYNLQPPTLASGSGAPVLMHQVELADGALGSNTFEIYRVFSSAVKTAIPTQVVAAGLRLGNRCYHVYSKLTYAAGIPANYEIREVAAATATTVGEIASLPRLVARIVEDDDVTYEAELVMTPVFSGSVLARYECSGTFYPQSAGTELEGGSAFATIFMQLDVERGTRAIQIKAVVNWTATMIGVAIKTVTVAVSPTGDGIWRGYMRDVALREPMHVTHGTDGSVTFYLWDSAGPDSGYTATRQNILQLPYCNSSRQLTYDVALWRGSWRTTLETICNAAATQAEFLEWSNAHASIDAANGRGEGLAFEGVVVLEVAGEPRQNLWLPLLDTSMIVCAEPATLVLATFGTAIVQQIRAAGPYALRRLGMNGLALEAAPQSEDYEGRQGSGTRGGNQDGHYATISNMAGAGAYIASEPLLRYGVTQIRGLLEHGFNPVDSNFRHRKVPPDYWANEGVWGHWSQLADALDGWQRFGDVRCRKIVETWSPVALATGGPTQDYDNGWREMTAGMRMFSRVREYEEGTSWNAMFTSYVAFMTHASHPMFNAADTAGTGDGGATWLFDQRTLYDLSRYSTTIRDWVIAGSNSGHADLRHRSSLALGLIAYLNGAASTHVTRYAASIRDFVQSASMDYTAIGPGTLGDAHLPYLLPYLEAAMRAGPITQADMDTAAATQLDAGYYPQRTDSGTDTLYYSAAGANFTFDAYFGLMVASASVAYTVKRPPSPFTNDAPITTGGVTTQGSTGTLTFANLTNNTRTGGRTFRGKQYVVTMADTGIGAIYSSIVGGGRVGFFGPFTTRPEVRLNTAAFPLRCWGPSRMYHAIKAASGTGRMTIVADQNVPFKLMGQSGDPDIAVMPGQSVVVSLTATPKLVEVQGLAGSFSVTHSVDSLQAPVSADITTLRGSIP